MVVKVFKLDNRVILGLVFLLGLFGVILIGDWQAIGKGEPCSLGEPNITGGEMLSEVYSGVDTNSSFYQQFCEALSSSTHQCFWNPQSRVTGTFCNTCLPTCLSIQTTIGFYQFTVGIILISIATPLELILVSAITSSIAPVTSQVKLVEYHV